MDVTPFKISFLRIPFRVCAWVLTLKREALLLSVVSLMVESSPNFRENVKVAMFDHYSITGSVSAPG